MKKDNTKEEIIKLTEENKALKAKVASLEVMIKAFNNTKYQVMITHIITENTPPGNGSTSCIATKTTTNFKVNRNQQYLSAVQWVACGKA